MPTLLVHMPLQGGTVKRSALEVLSHARSLAEAEGLTLAAVVIAPDPQAHVETVQRYGAQTVYTVADPIFANHINAPVLAALEAVIAKSDPRLVLFASMEATKDVLGALAVRCDAAALPDVSSIAFEGDAVTALRPVMAAKRLARVRTTRERVLASVRAGSYDASEAPVEATVEEVPFSFDEDTLRLTLREVISASSGTVDLSEARVVVAAGRGVKDEEGKALIEALADRLGAAIGASRAVVENGLFPATTQIGQTGKVVSPDLYFAIGISGAIQHVAGMQNSRTIVAINKDADAPIFEYATYGIVGDLYKVLPLLIEELEAVS